MDRQNPFMSIVVLNYNGKELLARYLPSILLAKRNYPHSEVWVVDNGSSDGSVEFLRENFPEVQILALTENLYFAGALNVSAKKLPGDLFFFLNNDVELEPHVLRPLVKHFSDESVFSASPRVLRPSQNMKNEAILLAKFQGGFLNVWCADPPGKGEGEDHVREIFHPCGPAMLVDREKFLALGGFEELLIPFYIEEPDLGIRAWRRGWRSLYEPLATATHAHNQTIGKAHSQKRAFVSYRKNQYIFMWKNISDPFYLLAHFFQFVLVKLIIPNVWEWIAFWSALRVLPKVISARRNAFRSATVFSDREIVERVAFPRI